MTQVVGYRHAAYDSPWWVNANAQPGRFHRAFEEATQYVALHPLGPAAEVLRHHVGPEASPEVLESLALNLWAVIIDLEELVQIGFDECADHGITPQELVGDDWVPTHQLADRLRADDAAGMIVPSAALPATHNAILFGPRVAHPYLWEPITPEELPTGHLTDGARPPAEVRELVCWIGQPHTALMIWEATGRYEPLDDPLATRW